MGVALATRMRALWLVCLLVFAPVGPAGLILSGHPTGEETHAPTVAHDASDHGISAGALAEASPDQHCLYCQSASTHRFGWVEASAHPQAPSSTPIVWADLQEGAPRSDSRAALPARAPPVLA